MREQLKLENQLCFPLYAAAGKVTGFYSPHLKAARHHLYSVSCISPSLGERVSDRR